MLLSTINLHYYQELMQGIRAAIAENRFEDFRRGAKEDWARGDIPAVEP
jgi:queuine tRNA-ribosyltransferase